MNKKQTKLLLELLSEILVSIESLMERRTEDVSIGILNQKMARLLDAINFVNYE